MGCSCIKEKTANSPWIFNQQPLRPITCSSSTTKYHQAENLDRILKKTVWEARVIIENEKNKQAISTKNATKQTSHRLKQILYVRLSLDNGIDINLREVQSLYQSLRNIKSLSKLSLKCPASVRSTDFLRTFSCELKKNAKSLNTLNLDLHPFVEMNAKEMKALYSLLNCLRYISNLTLRLALTNVTLKELGSTLKSLRSLTTLHLISGSSINLDAKAIAKFVSSLRLLPWLSNLSLVFYKDCIDDQGLQSLSLGLKHLTTLSSFSFKLYLNDKVTSQGITDFFMNLRSLTWIYDLSFGLYDCRKVSDKVMKSLCSMLKHLISLSSLTLKLDRYMGKQPITELSRCFSNLPLLASLTLYLRPGDNWATNKDLEVLILALQQLKCLSSLHIDLTDAGCVDDKGIKGFSRYLINLSRLFSFTLVLGSCERISNKGIEDLCKALSQLTLLTKLNLNFRRCQNILSGATEHLHAISKRLNLLSNLELNFDFLWNFDQHKLNEFASQLKKVNPSLKLLKLQGHSSITEDASKIKRDYYYF